VKATHVIRAAKVAHLLDVTKSQIEVEDARVRSSAHSAETALEHAKIAVVTFANHELASHRTAISPTCQVRMMNAFHIVNPIAVETETIGDPCPPRNHAVAHREIVADVIVQRDILSE
jgi:hypothetical protein